MQPARMISCVLSMFVIALMGCQSPSLDDRISADQEAFNSWPPDVQEAILNGQIEVGFTREQVRMAWGKPDDIVLETTSEGQIERWVWTKSSPSFGIGLGVGSFGGSSGVSGGVGTTVGGRTNVLAVVNFSKGEVISFEQAR